MMFDLEEVMEKISQAQTREYFKEVYSSYTSGNYRAMIVSLWTVILCDIVFKLQHLSDFEGDDTAKKILADLEAVKSHKESMEWEKTLLEKGWILQGQAKERLERIRSDRNRCAHPSLSDELVLFQPTKEEARAALRNALEELLLKPAMLPKKIVDKMVKDLAAKSRQLADRKTLATYLDNRYFHRLDKTSCKTIFRALWKFVIHPTDEDIHPHRAIYYASLFHLLSKPERRSWCVEFMESELGYYTRFIEEADVYGKEYAITLLGCHLSHLYHAFPENIKNMIKLFVNETQYRGIPRLDRAFVATFLASNLKEHFEQIPTEYDFTNIRPEVIEILYVQAQEVNLTIILHEVLTRLYSHSRNWDEATIKFSTLIAPFMSFFSQAELLHLMQKTNDNEQTSATRWQAKKDHPTLLAVFFQKGGTKEQLENLQLSHWVNLVDTAYLLMDRWGKAPE